MSRPIWVAVAACSLLASCGGAGLADEVRSSGTADGNDRSTPTSFVAADAVTDVLPDAAVTQSTALVVDLEGRAAAGLAPRAAAGAVPDGGEADGTERETSTGLEPRGAAGAVPDGGEADGTEGGTSTDLQPGAAAGAAAETGEAGGVEVGETVEVDTALRIPAGQSWAPMASFGAVTLLHPSIRIERIGFHQSNNDGARQLEPAPGAVDPLVLESRDRDTGSRTAIDVVVEPGTEIRAPVTGTVMRAGGYVLYCEHNDDFVVIEPDARPGWEVKILHIDGVMVSQGDRVEAGVTVLAPAATVLPFDSQVDEFTAEPSWPHVHIELVDPSIPDRPSPGGGC